MASHKYVPLPSNRHNFRLLELLPSSDRQSPLHCCLRIAELANPPTYDAISYVWRVFRDDRDDATIQCEGHTLPITANLARALRGVRDAHTSRLIWADAVCINQTDLDERKDQVQCMKAVFENAANVLVWLGDDEAYLNFDPAELFGFLDTVAGLCPAPVAKYGRHAEDDFVQLDRYLREAPARNWEMLRELHECMLFHRIWIVQELNLAADGFLLAGRGHQLRLSSFKFAMFWIRKRRPIEIRKFHIPWENLDPFLYLRFIIGDTSRPPASITGKSGQQPVYFVLRSIRNCAATNPRDMIYGLLGHSSLEKWTQPMEGYTQVPVDYTIPHTQIYIAVAQRLLQEAQPLFTLSLVEHHEDAWSRPDQECPSWVPRWDMDRQQYILADEYRDRYEKRRTKPERFALKDGPAVEIDGCVVDTIVWRSESMTLERFRAGLSGLQGSTVIQSDAINPIGQSWEHLREANALDSQDIAKEEQLLWDFALTLNAGCRILSKQTYREEVTEEQRVTDCVTVLSALGASLSDHITTKYTDGGDWDRFLATTQDICRERCFFITAKGFLGMGPRVSTIGDRVCVFYGAQVPFVLNASSPSGGSDEYRLCGECYVHGMMYGEALDALDAGEVEHKVFRLI